MLRDTILFKLLANHEASDVLQEDQWDLTLAAHLYEVGSF